MRILLVDDDDFARAVLSQCLTQLGHEIEHASDGAAAWARLQETRFPVVISDWIMPHMDGLELCRKIRSRRGQYTYVILLTVMDDQTSYLEAMQAGADDFLSKPFHSDVLAARLRVAERLVDLQRLVQLIPICSYCRRVRDDGNLWGEWDRFLMAHPDIARLTHGICPECYDRLEADLALE